MNNMNNTNGREKFVNEILMKLDMCNYGFKIEKYGSNGYDFRDVRNMKAIKELKIRLNIWKITGKLDKGEIDYPEAKRKIKYILHPEVGKCRVDLLRK